MAKRKLTSLRSVLLRYLLLCGGGCALILVLWWVIFMQLINIGFLLPAVASAQACADARETVASMTADTFDSLQISDLCRWAVVQNDTVLQTNMDDRHLKIALNAFHGGSGNPGYQYDVKMADGSFCLLQYDYATPYADPALRSENTNFALLVSNHFTEPFNEPYRYGKHIASLSNMLAGGVLVQRFGDLIRGVRSNAHRMSKSTTHPTLTAAVPGDLSLALPKRQLDDIIEMIYALDKLAPGTANYDTLLYGAEVKFYSARLKLTSDLETPLKNFFAAGDGAGITRGLAQAGASGVRAARAIAKRIEEEG